MKFADKLTNLRKANNLSQEQLADLIGVSRQAVSKWETGESYPDMAKMMQLCKILNCKLEELLDDGVLASETTPEKKAVNKTTLSGNIRELLNYVTRIYNMFIHMTWKTRLVMLLEMGTLAVLILAAALVIYFGLQEITRGLLRALPESAYYAVSNFIFAIYQIALFVLGFIIVFHIFNIRYLDYYVTIEDAAAEKQSTEEPIHENINSSSLVENKNPKIVIRDPKHSSSRIIEFLASVLIVLFKGLMVICWLPVLALLMIAIGLSVLVICNLTKGITFFYVLLIMMGGTALLYILAHFLFNVIFASKQPYKVFLITLFSGLILIGGGLGLTINNVSGFKEISSVAEVESHTEKIILDDISENTRLEFSSNDSIDYIVDNDLKTINIEATVPNGYSLNYCIFEEGEERNVYFFNCSLDSDSPLAIYRLLVEDIKNKRISLLFGNYDVFHVQIRLSEENYRMIHPFRNANEGE